MGRNLPVVGAAGQALRPVRCRRKLPTVRALLALLTILLAAADPGAAQEQYRLERIDTAVVAARRLTESSGVVASALVRGVYWTHNDSGDGPFLYATDSAGRDLGAVRVAGAGARDWEDLTAGDCLVVPGRCLYVGDIGDNGRHRRSVVVYRLREPRPPSAPADTLRVVSLLDSIVLVYPDRAHDAEALAITRSGDLLIVTKDRAGPAVLFRASAGRGDGPRLLRRVGALAMRTGLLTGRLATGAALSPDGAMFAVRTYVSIHLFRLAGDSIPVPLTGPSGLTIPVVEAQGEAVTFEGVDRLVLTSERGSSDHTLLTRLRVARTGTPAGVGPGR
jgi:hypothetical protein